MERNDRYYEENRRRNYGENRNQGLENYRDRYGSGGNYYGMPDEGHEYRNVRSTGRTDFGVGGPVQTNDSSGHHSGTSGQGNRDQYHYGDPNPHMGNRRNGGYEQTRGTGWRSESDSGRGRGNYSGNSFGNEDRYGRQDNSYRYSGQGRNYNEFGRDENRTDDRSRSWNAGTGDYYRDRGPHRERREDNNYNPYRSHGESPFYEGSYDNSDFRYSGEIKNSRRHGDEDNDNYATGLYASNRAYLSDNDDQGGSFDGDRTSSRERRSGRSGPNYGADSQAGNYGYDTFGV